MDRGQWPFTAFSTSFQTLIQLAKIRFQFLLLAFVDVLQRNSIAMCFPCLCSALWGALKKFVALSFEHFWSSAIFKVFFSIRHWFCWQFSHSNALLENWCTTLFGNMMVPVLVLPKFHLYFGQWITLRPSFHSFHGLGASRLAPDLKN